MATTKKRSTAAPKNRSGKRPATKKAVRAGASAGNAVTKEAPARKKVATSKKRATPKKVTAPRKAAAPEKAVSRKRIARPAPKRGASRPANADEFINPREQLRKVSAGTSAPAIARGVSRGSPAQTAGASDGPPMPEGFFSAYTGATLTEQDYADAAQTLGCEVAAVKAVAEVETAGASFDVNKRPTILYERHIFARCTVPPGKFDQTHPDLSGFRKPYPPGTYGSKDQQFVKLARALQLDPDAALKAPSWGKFQILGENYKACGFRSVADFAKAMTISESEHLKAFVKFLLNNASMIRAIRNKDWAAFAKSYNGPAFATFKYDTKLAAAYAKHARSA